MKSIVSFLIMMLAFSCSSYAQTYYSDINAMFNAGSSENREIFHTSLCRWTSNPSWYLNANAICSGTGPDSLDVNKVQQHVAAAFGQWAGVTTANVSFSCSGTTSDTYGSDSKNVLYWTDSTQEIAALDMHTAFGRTKYYGSVSNNTFSDVDIIFNSIDGYGPPFIDVNWTTNPAAISSANAIVDVRSIAVHEIGHLLGIGHYKTDVNAIMNNYEWNTDRWTLKPDDRTAVSYLYGGNIIEDVTISNNAYFSQHWNITIPSGITLTFHNVESVVSQY